MNNQYRFQYVADTAWARDMGRYLKTGIILFDCYSDLENTYTKVLFDGETQTTFVYLTHIELIEDNVEDLSTSQAKSLLLELFSQGFGIAGHRVPNGADYYQCTACHATTETMGYADSIGSVAEVKHKPGCQLLKLLEWSSD